MTRKMTKRDRKDLDRLAELLKGVSPERLETVLKKRAQVNIRMSETDKAGMRRLSAELKLTLTDYVLRLHYFAQDRLDRLARQTAQTKRKE